MSIDGCTDTADDEGHALGERLGAASMQRVALTGPRASHPTVRLRSPFADPPSNTTDLGRRQARIEGFNLHADTTDRARSRDRLERLCRYLLRPPLSAERLERRGEKVRLELKSPWRFRNDRDLVTRIPLAFSFDHVGGLAHFEDGRLTLQSMLDESVPRGFSDLWEHHFMDGYYGQLNEWNNSLDPNAPGGLRTTRLGVDAVYNCIPAATTSP